MGKQHAQVIVKVNDRYSGLDSELSPLLFSKFALKSFKATGLGLFVAKSIVEAHNARDGKRIIVHTQEKVSAFTFYSSNYESTIKS